MEAEYSLLTNQFYSQSPPPPPPPLEVGWSNNKTKMRYEGRSKRWKRKINDVQSSPKRKKRSQDMMTDGKSTVQPSTFSLCCRCGSTERLRILSLFDGLARVQTHYHHLEVKDKARGHSDDPQI